MQWIEPVEQRVSDDYYQAVGGNYLVAQALYNRGLSSVQDALEFLKPERYTSVSPLEIPGMDRAVERIATALIEREPILVWGDFDVDGQTAATLLVSTFRDLGGQVDYHLPVRANESHGVNVTVLQQILKRADTPVRLLITCDTGISDHQAVSVARLHNVEMIITDHHALPPTLPDAFAVVNPRLLPEGHALATLPGVGVAYKLAEELYQRIGQPEKSQTLLDLAAVGIVADVAQLRGETRYLLQRGLELMRTNPRIGFKVMMELAELDMVNLSEEHIGFSLGPRLNAIGRLGDANPVVELLSTTNIEQARTLAYQLEGLNSKRQLLTNQVYRGALAQLEQDPALLEGAVLLLSHPSWPAGVIGIVASRLVERFQKPVILVASPKGQPGRASARSVEGIDITSAIASQANLLESYGGHAMAAGFSIQEENLPAFRRGLNRVVQKSGLPEQPNLTIDGFVGLDELTLDFAVDLDRLAPYGAGNPLLVLATRGVKILNQTTVGRNNEHLLLTVEDRDSVSRRVIWWQGTDELDVSGLPEGEFDIAYAVRPSTYGGQRDVQITWRDYRQTQEYIDLHTRNKPEAEDYRQEKHPLPIVRNIVIGESAQIWAEAGAKHSLADLLPDKIDLLHNRLELIPCEVLVIWSAPPGRFELSQAVRHCQPRKIVLIGVDPEVDALEPFLNRLVGLVKYSLANHAGVVNLDRMASAMAHRAVTVLTGLKWIASQGFITLAEMPDGMLQIGQGSDIRTEVEQMTDKLLIEQLKLLLDETAAFRAFFKRAEIVSLL